MWNMTIACALRRGVASVGNFSIGRGSPYKGKNFRCKTNTSGRQSFETAIVKKAEMWLLITFLYNLLEQSNM